MLNLRKLLGIERPAAQAAKKAASGAVGGAIALKSQRDFPGKTNYGVPQDDMIDTPGGYITRQQYDKNLMTNGYLRGAIHEDEGFVGTPRNLNQMSPANADIRNFTRGRTGYYQGSNPFINSLNDDYNLRVR